jgi:hypothetical protein
MPVLYGGGWRIGQCGESVLSPRAGGDAQLLSAISCLPSLVCHLLSAMTYLSRDERPARVLGWRGFAAVTRDVRRGACL